MKQLKKCPFCGGKAQIQSIMATNPYNFVECKNGNCNAVSAPCNSEDEAISRWNNRYSPKFDLERVAPKLQVTCRSYTKFFKKIRYDKIKIRSKQIADNA